MATSNRGVFAVDRGVFDHRMFKREPFCEIAAWLWLISEAQWAERKVRRGRAEISLQRGQLAASRADLCQAWMWPEGRVRGFLARQEKSGRINQLPTSETTIITICDYDDFQFGSPAGEKDSNHLLTSSSPAANQHTKKERREEVKNKESSSLRSEGPVPENGGLFADSLPATTAVSPSRKTGKKQAREESTWPDRFELDGELHRYAEDAGIPFQEIPALWERFKNHHQAKGTRFKDWRAAWRTWVGNEIKFSRDRRPNGSGMHNTPSGRAPAMDAGIQYLNRILREESNG